MPDGEEGGEEAAVVFEVIFRLLSFFRFTMLFWFLICKVHNGDLSCCCYCIDVFYSNLTKLVLYSMRLLFLEYGVRSKVRCLRYKV